jgi:nitrate/nitrite transporter NarK
MIFWTIPLRFLTGIAAAGAMAFISSISLLGGFVGPAVMGRLKSSTGGMTAMAGFWLVAALLSLLLRSLVPPLPQNP